MVMAAGRWDCTRLHGDGGSRWVHGCVRGDGSRQEGVYMVMGADRRVCTWHEVGV